MGMYLKKTFTTDALLKGDVKTTSGSKDLFLFMFHLLITNDVQFH